MRDGLSGIRRPDSSGRDHGAADPVMTAASSRFFPNRRVDPTASGLVVPWLAQSPAVDHASRLGANEAREVFR